MTFSDDHVQMIRHERKTFERTQQIPEHLLEFVYEEKLFKLLVPKELGGMMLDFPQAIKVFQEASRIDGNFGWIITIGSGGGMFVPNIREEAIEDIFSPKDAVIAGSGFPAGIAYPTDKGYIVSGKWFYCSGSQYATTFTATCHVQGEDNNKHKIIAAALRPDQVQIIEDWDAFGLKGTTSHSVSVTNQFVPHERMFSVFKDQNARGNLIHSFPFMIFSEASFAAISLGIGMHFLEEISLILESNKDNWPKERYVFLKDILKKEEIRLKMVNKHFHQVVKDSWDMHIKSKDLSAEIQQNFSVVAKRSVATSIDCASHLFRYIGMHAVMEESALNQIFRDLHTASQHTFLTPKNIEESLPYEDKIYI